MKELCGYAAMWRTGLGNMMLPWARCHIWCLDNQARMIAPIWRRLRLGQYLRDDRDKRQYHRLFSDEGYQKGLGRALRLTTWPRVTEAQAAVTPPKPGTVVVFHGTGPYFAPIRSRSAEVRKELRRITHPWAQRQEAADHTEIALHVRRGDFSNPQSVATLRGGGENYRIPLEWYIDVLRELRSNLGRRPAVIASDGSESELAALLSEPNVRLLPPAESPADMLALSSACALIASGSTFSMWASYLGQVPAIWYPGQKRQNVLANDDPALEPEWEPGDPLNDKFLSAAALRIAP